MMITGCVAVTWSTKWQVHGVIEVMEGEPRYVLCNAVDKHGADLLIVGSHGYGAIKRCPMICLGFPLFTFKVHLMVGFA